MNISYTSVIPIPQGIKKIEGSYLDMKNLMSKLVALLLVMLTLTPVLATTAAAASWPSTSSSKYCEFVASKQINVYRNSSCTTRGTSSPAKSYNAYISKNDVCRILSFSSSYIKLQYPTSSGYKTGYIKRADLLSVSAPTTTVKSASKVTTYKTAGGASYGYIAKNDTVYVCGTQGSYTVVIYPAKSGSRAYKLGYIKTSDYSKIKQKDPDPTPKPDTGSTAWQWPMSGYSTTQKFNNYSSSMAKNYGRPYHCGIDIKSSNTTVMAAADGTVKYKGYSSGNGYHIVLSHKVNGTTVYTLYSHLSSYSSCPSVGSSVRMGAKIGVMGNTGRSSGPHLHFAIFSGTYSSDPDGYAYNSGTNKITHKGSTFYNPVYVIKNGKLP